MLIEEKIKVGDAYKQIVTGRIVEILEIEYLEGRTLFCVVLHSLERSTECRKWNFWIESSHFLKLHEHYAFFENDTPIMKNNTPAQLNLFL